MLPTDPMAIEAMTEAGKTVEMATEYGVATAVLAATAAAVPEPASVHVVPMEAVVALKLILLSLIGRQQTALPVTMVAREVPQSRWEF